MIGELTAALASANSLTSIISTAISTKNLADLNKVQIHISELIGELISAQMATSQLVNEKRELEGRLLELENKLKDFERYELHEMAVGVFAYRLREACKNGEPIHYICPRCRNNGKKFPLQRFEDSISITHRCAECQSSYLEQSKPMQQPIPVQGRFQ